MRHYFCGATPFSASSKSCLDTIGWHGWDASLHGRCVTSLTDSLPPRDTESGGDAIPAGYPVRKKKQDFCREHNPEESKPGSRRRDVPRDPSCFPGLQKQLVGGKRPD